MTIFNLGKTDDKHEMCVKNKIRQLQFSHTVIGCWLINLSQPEAIIGDHASKVLSQN